MRLLGLVVLSWFTVGVAQAEFVDVTPSNIASPIATVVGGTVTDVDRDGDLDIVRANWTGGANRLFRNDGNLTFTSNSDPGFARSTANSKAGISFFDLDLDGDLDGLFMESGLVVFQTQDNPLDFEFHQQFTISGGRTGNVADWDGDGDLDVIAGDTNGASFLRNDGGTFTDIPGLNDVPSQVTTTTDFNRDGRPDVYFGTPGQLFRNDGAGETWSEIDTEELASDSRSARFADFDNDGDLDLLVGTLSPVEPFVFMRNDGDLGFTDILDESGDLTTDGAAVGSIAYGDYDNDQDLDLIVGTRSTANQPRLYRNEGNLVFQNRSLAELPAVFASNHQTMNFGDFDGDGRLDILVNPYGSVQLLQNQGESENNYLSIVLDGGASGILGIGSWIEVTAGGVTQTRYVETGVNWSSTISHEHHFGLGTNETADIRVEWRSGDVTTLTGVTANQKLLVQESTSMSLATAPYVPGVGFDMVFDPGAFTPTSATLFTREAGSSDAFDSAAMNFVAGVDNYQDAIPGGLATIHGIEYYIMVNETSPFPYGASAENPAFLPAQVANLALPDPPAASQYRMFGVPFVATSATLAGFLEPTLGAYDPTRYRLFRFDPLNGSNGSYREGGAAGSLDPGKGFWIAMSNPVAFGGSGTSTPTGAGVTLQIERGWNQIANPYQFEMPLASIDFSGAPNVEAELNTWDGSGYTTAESLLPWDAAFMFNPTAVAETIVIPGVNTEAAPAAQPQWSGPALTVDSWQESWADRNNVAGYADAATEVPDRLDRHAPPAPPGALRTYFERLDVDGGVHELNRDLQPMTGGATWDLVVEAPSDEAVQLRVSGLEELPVGHRAVLIPVETSATIDLSDRSELSLPGGRTHRFRLVSGPADYVQDVSEGRGGFTPVQFSLGLGYPNPFSAQTKIGFALPREETVEVAVYDVTGRRVRQLVNGAKAAGQHVVEWDGVDQGGRTVAPGVYFVQMQAGSFSDSRKVMVQR